MVSHNSARLLTAFWGVSGYGRVLVPVNFRLSRDEVAYIVEHSGARVLFVDPELADSLKGVEAEHTFVIGTDDDLLLDAEPREWEPDENATATVNYTSGTTARPKGVQLTHRNIWVDAMTFGWHTGVSDRDVYLHTLPMFHVNGWGMPFTMAGMGVPQVVLRKVDGHEILRRVERHGVTIMCAAPAVVAAVLECAQTWEGRSPVAAGPASWSRARRHRPGRSSASRKSSAGSSSRSTGSPRPRRCSPSTGRGPSGTTCPAAERAARLEPRRDARARRTPARRRARARCWRGPTSCSRGTGRTPRRPRGCSRAAGSTPVTAA